MGKAVVKVKLTTFVEEQCKKPIPYPEHGDEQMREEYPMDWPLQQKIAPNALIWLEFIPKAKILRDLLRRHQTLLMDTPFMFTSSGRYLTFAR